MKIYPYLLAGVMALLSGCTDTLPHQEKEELGYRIENGQVVFEFDLRDYQKATQDGQHQVYDFRDLEVVEVAVAGEFNNWSKDGWKMRQIDDYRFQLRKKLKDFDGKFEWQYKFIVNEKYWIEPPVKARNQVEMYPGYRKSRNLVLNTEVPTPSLEGNTTFRLSGYPNARRVVLSGTFNQWNEKQIYFGQVEGEWICRIDLGPGRHEYKFIVDGEWITDPANPQKVQNEHGTFNSVLHHQMNRTTFSLDGFPSAKEVSIAGTFNQWNPAGQACQKVDAQWICQVDLPPGNHAYKFVVDGQWIADPKNPHKEKDGFGGYNSLLAPENTYTFRLKGFQDARKVSLAGSFNDWNDDQYLMQREGQYWVFRLPLEPGLHTYKFVVDGRWMLDPSNPNWKDDGKGHINSVIKFSLP